MLTWLLLLCCAIFPSFKTTYYLPSTRSCVRTRAQKQICSQAARVVKVKTSKHAITNRVVMTLGQKQAPGPTACKTKASNPGPKLPRTDT